MLGLRGPYAAAAMCLALVMQSARVGAAPPEASDRDACIGAAESAQTFQHAAKLLEARSQLVTCSRDACPRLVREDCTRWLSDVSEAIPTIVVHARGPNGDEIADVSVHSDGALLAPRLDGRALDINPGDHLLRFESGGRMREQRVMIVQAKKARLIEVDFGTPDATLSRNRPVPVATWMLGGVGVAALGASAFFFAQAVSFNNRLDDLHCAPRCAPEDGDTLNRLALYSYASLGVGVAALAAATAFYVFRPARSAATEVGFAITPTPRGVSFAGSTTF